MNSIQTKIQREAIEAWRERGCKGTIQMATGTGKSKVGIMAIEEDGMCPDSKILIITPTQIIRDKEWREQFEEWSSISYTSVVTVCIQTCYKWVNTHWDLIICDEIHRYIPKNDTIEYKYFKFFLNNTWDKILGLSGSISKDILFRLNKIAPIVYSMNTNEARDLDIVSPFEIYNLPIELREEEKVYYNSLTRGIDQAKFKGYHAWSLINKRKTLLYNAANKLQVIKEVSKLEGQGIIFSQHISYADKVAFNIENCLSYHSGQTKDERIKVLDKFLNKEIRIISAATALDEGFNLPDLKFAIVAAGTSKERSFIQRLGRIVRKYPDKKAILVRLYVKGTQDEVWLRNSQKDYNVKFINQISEIYERDNITTEV